MGDIKVVIKVPFPEQSICEHLKYYIRVNYYIFVLM